jgi:putative peptidoglycan lipid II flippase
MDGLKKILSEAMSIISMIVIPATIGAIVFSRPIVELLFSRGAFDEKAAIMTSSAFLFYSLGMLGSGNRSTLVRAFYSLHDAKTPVINSFTAMIVNLILNLILSKFLGVGGLALASSIAAFLSMSLMMVSLRKKIGPLGLKKYFVSLLLFPEGVVTADLSPPKKANLKKRPGE